MTDVLCSYISEPVQVRAAEDNHLVAEGYAWVFDRDSEPIGGVVERIAPAAATKDGAVRALYGDVRALFNHDFNQVLGSLAAGTLRVVEDDHGGHYEVDLPDTALGRDLAKLLERRDIRGSSMGFLPTPGGVRYDEDPETGLIVRTITGMAIRDVGPVTIPAYRDTDARLRSIAADLGTTPERLAEVVAAGEARSLLTGASSEAPRPRRRAYPV